MAKLKEVGKVVLKFADKHLPEILSAAALLGLGGAVVRATSRAPVAVEVLTDAKLNKVEKLDEHALDIYRNEDGELCLDKIKLNPWEWFKAEAPVYLDTWIITIATGACIVLSNRVSARRYAALLAAFSLKSKNLEEYKEKVKELFGEKKAEEVKAEVNKDCIMDIPEKVKHGYSANGENPTFPCFLRFSNVWIYGNTVAIERAFNLFNSQYLMRNGDATVADLYYAISEFCIIPDDNFRYDTWLSSRNWWEYDGTADSLLKPILSYGSTVDGIPCLIVDTSRPTDKFDP